MEHVDHILIVDDDREIRELVGNYLKRTACAPPWSPMADRCAVFSKPTPST